MLCQLSYEWFGSSVWYFGTKSSFFDINAEIATIFGPNVVAISARNTKVYKICELCKAIFSAFYNISQPNFAILL